MTESEHFEYTDTTDTQVVRIDESHVMLNPWGVDITNHFNVLRIVAERLSIVRYVFLVQIEDGIASAAQRASLEYADAVLIGWPENTDDDVVNPSVDQFQDILAQVSVMEDYVNRFRTMEQESDIDGMTDTLIRITERVAYVRRVFQPNFLLPTFAEIRRVVQDEWDEDMGKIDYDTTDGQTPGPLRSLQDEFEQLVGEGDEQDKQEGSEESA